jgi:ankyrin repeat protein
LFHVLSANCQGCRFEHLERIYNTLIKRGLSCTEKDGYERIPLHYAVISGHFELVKKLINDGNNVNSIDMYGYNPLILYLKGKNITKQIY